MVSEKGKAARAAYMREWRKANKDKCKEYREKYWEKKAAAAQDGNTGKK